MPSGSQNEGSSKMYRRSHLLLLLLGVLILPAACGSKEPDRPAAESSIATPTAQLDPVAQKIANGAQHYRECAVCHTITPDGRHMVGPNLRGIVGQPAGRYPNFTYSKALLRSDLVWDEKTLDAYIHMPQDVIPGTRMAYQGMRNPKKREELIAYLKTLSSETGDQDQ